MKQSAGLKVDNYEVKSDSFEKDSRPLVYARDYYEQPKARYNDIAKMTNGSRIYECLKYSELNDQMSKLKPEYYQAEYVDEDKRSINFIYRIGKKLVKSPVQSNLILFIARAFDMDISPARLEMEVWKRSTICIYYAYGDCIHPECKWAHEVNLKGILKKYYSEFTKVTKRSSEFNKTDA